MKSYGLIKYKKIIMAIIATLIIVFTITIFVCLVLSNGTENQFIFEKQNTQTATKENIPIEDKSTTETGKDNTTPIENNASSNDNGIATKEKEIPKEVMHSPEIDFIKYGIFTIEGMTNEDYKTYNNLQWTRLVAEGEPEDLEIDLERQYTYKELENFMINLAKHDNVFLDIIGKTEQGRNIYSLSIDYNYKNTSKDVILNTGQTHALEFAGGLYILKQYSELIELAQSDPSIKQKLENVSYHAIPIVNPDGREMIINGGNTKQKSNANGVDINRNFNSINAGQKANNVNMNDFINAVPGLGNFPGYTLGSEAETQAVMKWLEKYIKTSKGKVYLFDYHQMGHVIYSDKPWRPLPIENLTKNIQKDILGFLNEGVAANHYVYAPEASTYGLEGVGGTLTDYFVSIADGSSFSEKHGRLMYEIDHVEMPLIQFKDVDKFTSFYKPINPNCIAMTLEIGASESALGYGSTARSIMSKEYVEYNYNSLLLFVADLILDK